MPSADTLPLAELLAPLDGIKQGPDLRDGAGPGSPYYLVKDARAAARAAERSLENGDADASPDWAPVARHALAALKTTRDLELAAYLTEAQLRLKSFAGLRDGFRLLAGLVRDYWPDLYPVPDEDGVSTTIAPVAGLNGEDAPGTLIAPIYRTPLAPGVSYADYLEAAETAKILDDKARDKKIAAGAKTFDKLRAEVGANPAAQTRLFHDDLEAAIGAFGELSAAFAERAPEHAPPTSATRAALDAVLAAARDLGRDHLAATAARAQVAAPAPAGEAPSQVERPRGPGPPRTRGRAAAEPARPRRRARGGAAVGGLLPPHRAALAGPLRARAGGALGAHAPARAVARTDPRRRAARRAVQAGRRPAVLTTGDCDMAGESVHDKLGRVRAPRVHISYQVETEGATVEKELPFVVGVLGDFAGQPADPLKPLKDRKFTQIDRDNFDDVLGRIAPGLNLKVANTLAGDGSEMALTLKFQSMADFDPENVAQQVEPVRKLLATRDKLRDLLAKVDRSEDLENLLDQVLQNTDQLKQLQGELGAPGA